MTTLNRALILDLARLYSRYEPDDWDALICAVLDEASRSRLVEVLRGFAEAGHALKKTASLDHTRSQKADLAVLLKTVESEDPEKSRLITQLHRGLVSRAVLPSARQLREFATTCGVILPRGARREQVIVRIIHFFIGLPLADIQSRLAHDLRSRRNPDKEFERWAGIIMHRREAPDVFEGPDRRSYRLTVTNLFSGFLGFLGIQNPAESPLDVFAHIQVDSSDMRRFYSLRFNLIDLREMCERGLFPRRPTMVDWHRLCVRTAPRYLFTEDGSLRASDPHRLTTLLVERMDLEKACASA